MRYSNNKIFYPQMTYNINFENIKQSLTSKDIKWVDYGSIIFIEEENLLMTVNNVGKVEFFFDNIDTDNLEKDLHYVESIFKEQVQDFKMLM